MRTPGGRCSRGGLMRRRGCAGVALWAALSLAGTARAEETRVRGVVVDAAGLPVSNAEAFVLCADRDRRWMPPRTDRLGRFEDRQEPGARCRVWARKDAGSLTKGRA